MCKQFAWFYFEAQSCIVIVHHSMFAKKSNNYILNGMRHYEAVPILNVSVLSHTSRNRNIQRFFFQ